MGIMSPIKDYAIIGDGRSAALVSRQGSIDWLCWPRFDSASVFGALLDERAGFWRIAPAGHATSERRYVNGSNVLETTFQTDRGRWVLTDLMPAASEKEKRASLEPEHEIVRRMHCLSGEAEVEMVFAPRPSYGREAPRVRTVRKLGYRVAPSGAIVAAPTTSLPERVGGDLNWDYRYTWLRDASMTVRAMFGLGFETEAEAFVGWLLHATRLTRPRLRILYDVYGNNPYKEPQ